MVVPVIERAPFEERMATTSAMSSGLPIRFRARMPSAAFRPLFGLGEVRRVGVDDARRDRVDADALWVQSGGEILDQRIVRALGRGIGLRLKRPQPGPRKCTPRLAPF
jgi:hypothetical protein